MAFHCRAIESLGRVAGALREVDGGKAAADLRARLLDPEPLVEGPGMTYDSKTPVGPQTTDEVLSGGVRSGMASQMQAAALSRTTSQGKGGSGAGAGAGAVHGQGPGAGASAVGGGTGGRPGV